MGFQKENKCDSLKKQNPPYKDFKTLGLGKKWNQIYSLKQKNILLFKHKGFSIDFCIDKSVSLKKEKSYTEKLEFFSKDFSFLSKQSHRKISNLTPPNDIYLPFFRPKIPEKKIFLKKKKSYFS